MMTNIAELNQTPENPEDALKKVRKPWVKPVLKVKKRSGWTTEESQAVSEIRQEKPSPGEKKESPTSD